MSSSASILTSIKKVLGVDAECDAFDTDILMQINATFLTLSQLGVGPENGFAISGPEDEWTDFMEDGIVLNSVKSYIGLKVKQLFDPPQSSAVIESMKNQIAEYEFRMLTQVSVDKRKGV